MKKQNEWGLLIFRRAIVGIVIALMFSAVSGKASDYTVGFSACEQQVIGLIIEAMDGKPKVQEVEEVVVTQMLSALSKSPDMTLGALCDMINTNEESHRVFMRLLRGAMMEFELILRRD